MFITPLNLARARAYTRQIPKHIESAEWCFASEGDVQVSLNTHRDEGLVGEGLMRDLARRVQTLRKKLGYEPTDILNIVHIAKLEDKDIKLLPPHLKELKELVRAKNVYLHNRVEKVETEWHNDRLGNKEIFISIS